MGSGVGGKVVGRVGLGGTVSSVAGGTGEGGVGLGGIMSGCGGVSLGRDRGDKMVGAVGRRGGTCGCTNTA